MRTRTIWFTFFISCLGVGELSVFKLQVYDPKPADGVRFVVFVVSVSAAVACTD